MNEALKRRLLTPDFVYRKAAETDIRKTFARIKREQAAKQSAVVTPIKRGATK